MAYVRPGAYKVGAVMIHVDELPGSKTSIAIGSDVLVLNENGFPIIEPAAPAAPAPAKPVDPEPSTASAPPVAEEDLADTVEIPKPPRRRY